MARDARYSAAPVSPTDVAKNLANPTRPFLYLLALNIIIGGLQLSWCAEFSNGTPYLLSLGMSKSLMSLVWIAGPMSGTIGQPLMGLWSDRCRLSYGRRRPFLWGGAVLIIASLLILSYSKDIVAYFSSPDISQQELKKRTIPLAVFFVYSLDFSIAVITAGCRAFIVDNVPTHQQQIANAWAARMTGIGHVIGYALGAIDLPAYCPWLGENQFKALSSAACWALVFTVIPACLYVKERDPNLDPRIMADDAERALKARTSSGFSHKLRELFDDTRLSFQRLSPQCKRVCKIQFFAWIGYFPVMFYTTTYVGSIYRREFLAANPHYDLNDENSLQLLSDESIRRGTVAFLSFSVVSLIANSALPFIVKPDYVDEDLADIPDSMLESGHQEALPNVFAKESKHAFSRYLEPTVANMWMYSHLLFAFCMVGTWMVDTSTKAIVLISVLGVPWALALWAPFTLISEELSRIRLKKAVDRRINFEYEPGKVLGIHNIFIAFPQVISSLLSSLLFAIFNSNDEAYSIAWVFRFGGVFALASAFFSTTLKSPDQIEQEDHLLSAD